MRSVHSGMMVVALFAASAATATTHRHHVTHHATGKAHTTKTHATKRHKASPKKPTRHEKAGPAGVTAIPAGGLKVYCAARNPLLIRKSTQGNGTTVTVICR